MGVLAELKKDKAFKERGMVVDERLERRVVTLGRAAVLGMHDYTGRKKMWDEVNSGKDWAELSYTTKGTPKSITDLYLNEELEAKANQMIATGTGNVRHGEKLLTYGRILKESHKYSVGKMRDWDSLSRETQVMIINMNRSNVV